MKRILATSAIAMMLSTPVLADAHSEMFMDKAEKIQILGSEFIGARVYVVEKDLDDDYEYSDDAEKEWDDIGEINEIVMTREGEIKAAVIGVGGFLGIGEKDVAVSMDKLRFVSDGDSPSDYFIVFTSTKSSLEAAPDWDEAERVHRVEQMRKARMDMQAQPYRSNMEAVNAVERDGYMTVMADKMEASELIGSRVYGTDDEDVGEISEVILTKGSNGKVAIIDVGGFIGIGEKPVAVPMGELKIMREKDGDDLRVYIDATEERLEGMPEYEDRD